MMHMNLIALVIVIGICGTYAKCPRLNGDEFVERRSGSSNKDGRLSTYRCILDDYRIVGFSNDRRNKSIRCNGTKWEEQRPCCEKKKCPAPVNGNFTIPVNPGVELEAGEMYTYQCINGYQSIMSLVITCQDGSFTYDKPPPTCMPYNCGKPEDGINTEEVPAATDLNFLESYEYECLEGYETCDKLCIVCGPDGFIGTPPNCTKAIYCDPDPCQNGGTCVEGVGGYCCECPPGSTGLKCENVTLDCTVSGLECMNGGTCAPSSPGSPNVCMCPPGWTGDRCETNIDECASNPCMNNGTCTDGIDMFTCTCANTWTGPTCEVRDCPSGWKVSPMKNCYLIRQSNSFLNRDWFNARDQCVVNGGALVVLQNLAKADDVFAAGGTTFGVDYWIGGGQLTSGTQNFYEWIDGTMVDSSVKAFSPGDGTSPELNMLTYRFNPSPPPDYYIFTSSSIAPRPYICEQ